MSVSAGPGRSSTARQAVGSNSSETGRGSFVTSARIGAVSGSRSTASAQLPALADLLAAAYVVRVPMREAFRGIRERETVLLDGPSGWGEFSAFPEYGDEEAARWLAAAVEAGWGSWPAARRDAVPVNATVPAVRPERVPEVLARFPGATTAKIKVAERGQGV